MIIDYPTREFIRSVTRRYNPPQIYTPRVSWESDTSIAAPEITIGFVGDICPLFGKNIRWDDDIISTFRACDWLVGNLEGCITSARQIPFRFLHSPAILEQLNLLSPPESWILGVANNHSGDYGQSGLDDTIDHLDEFGCSWFGTVEKPTVRLLNGLFGLSAWSKWLNRKNPKITRDDPGPVGAYSIAYPHWGYEFTSEPDESMNNLPGYDLVVGHHTHLPLPLESTADGRFIAWSLGNFTTGNTLPSLQSGAIMTVSWTLLSQPVMTKLRFNRLVIDSAHDSIVRVHFDES